MQTVKSVLPALFSVFLLSLVWPIGFVSSEWHSTYCFPHFWKFLLGALLAYAVQKEVDWKIIVLPLALTFVVACWHPTIATWAALITASSIAAAGYLEKLDQWLAYPWLVKIGVISYSLYLIHIPMEGLMLAVQTRVASNSAVFVLALLAIHICVCITLAFIVFRYIELPSIALSKWVKSRFSRKSSNGSHSANSETGKDEAIVIETVG